MSQLRVAPIVEGYGDVEAFPVLLRRIGDELLGIPIDVIRPIRQPKGALIKLEGVERAVQLARMKLANAAVPATGLILLSLDCDDDRVCELAPRLLSRMGGAAPMACACVLPNPEFETWFVGAAESLRRYLDDVTPASIPGEPEIARAKKEWIEQRFRGDKYRETVDQVRFAATMDLSACRTRCPSFDKLVRELRKAAAST